MEGVPQGFWGKLERDNDGRVTAWLPVADHCADVAACCEPLLGRTLLARRLAALAGRESLSSVVTARLGVLAALHDVGKFNLGSQNKALANPAATYSTRLRRGGCSPYALAMKVLTGTIVEGRIEVPAEFAAEGVQVVILAPESGHPIQLTATEESELSEAMEEIRRGDYVDGDALLSEIRSLQA